MLIAILIVVAVGWLLIQCVAVPLALWKAHRMSPERMEKKYPGSQQHKIRDDESGRPPRPDHTVADVGRARRWIRRST